MRTDWLLGCGAVLGPADSSAVWGDTDSRQSEAAIAGCVSPDSSARQMRWIKSQQLGQRIPRSSEVRWTPASQDCTEKGVHFPLSPLGMTRPCWVTSGAGCPLGWPGQSADERGKKNPTTKIQLL